ncbi:hypothetical protein D3C80_1159470 [compost metagenome]
MGKAHLLDGLGDVLGLVHVKRIGFAGRDVAEGAGAGADFTHDHEGRVLLVPALADIRTASFLAHRDQLVRTHQFARLVIALGGRRLDADPFRLAHDLGIGLMRLFRVANTLFFGRSPVENSDHLKPASIAFSDLNICWPDALEQFQKKRKPLPVTKPCQRRTSFARNSSRLAPRKDVTK